MHRASDCEELGLEANNKAAALEDVGHTYSIISQTCILYIANQEDNTQYAKLGAWPPGQRRALGNVKAMKL